MGPHAHPQHISEKTTMAESTDTQIDTSKASRGALAESTGKRKGRRWGDVHLTFRLLAPTVGSAGVPSLAC